MKNYHLRLVDFTKHPGPRFKTEGECSGEEWREGFLLPAFEKALSDNVMLIVDLDGAAGFASSFLEEAFGGLVRQTKLPWKEINSRLKIVCTDEPDVINQIRSKYLPDAMK